jgi:hypothetical protein
MSDNKEILNNVIGETMKPDKIEKTPPTERGDE